LNIIAEGDRDISNTYSLADSEAEIINQEARGEAAKQTIDGHMRGL